MEEVIYWCIIILTGAIASGFTIYSVSKWQGVGRYLCEDCRFNDPIACQKKERPNSIQCTSYRQINLQTK